MDILCRLIPQWAWSGINWCRLFLRANTLADNTSLEGKYIPQDICSVKAPIRQSKLGSPIQGKPSKQDIGQWRCLVDSVSANGRLHVPLGPWIRPSDQVFPYVQNPTKNIVYKRVANGWEVFGKTSQRSRHFKRMSPQVTTTEIGSLPVRVIETTSHILVVGNRPNSGRGNGNRGNHGDKGSVYEDRILGEYTTNAEQMKRLKIQWQMKECTVIAATDGGLKNEVGTSSYALFFPNDTAPILQGYAGEFQPSRKASNT